MGALTGRRIVVTRAAHQAEELAAPLRDLDAIVILLPTIGIAPPLDPAPLQAAARQCDTFDWIVFTSVNAIQAFVAQIPNPAAVKARVAAVGAATREAAERQHFHVSLTPATYVAESLVEAFKQQQVAGLRILIPSAAVTRDVVASELIKRGAEVSVVEAYRNVIPVNLTEQARNTLREPYPDWITFTSSSSADNLIQLVGVEPLQHLKIATIGPVTSKTVRDHGLPVSSEAQPHTISGLIAALCAARG